MASAVLLPNAALMRVGLEISKRLYLTPDKSTAERMARKKTRIMGGNPIVLSYEFRYESIKNVGLMVKVFPEKATAEWIRFVDRNRDRVRGTSPHEYDVVIGPIADDGVVLQLTNYRNEILTPEEAASRLQDKYLDQQYYFGTNKSLELLTKIDVWILS